MVDDKGRRLSVEEEDLFDGEEEDAQKNRYLTFHIANEVYGLEIIHVTEIVGIHDMGITEIPGMPDFVKGVINLRGQVIPVIDVRLRFKLQAKAYDDRTCVIVVRQDLFLVGLIVDTVSEVLIIPHEQISPPPAHYSGSDSRCIQGMGKVDDTVKILLDVNELMNMHECAKINESK